jgi:hypothetical protein
MYGGGDVGLLVGGTLGDTDIINVSVSASRHDIHERGRHDDSVGGSIIFVVASTISVTYSHLITSLLCYLFFFNSLNLLM